MRVLLRTLTPAGWAVSLGALALVAAAFALFNPWAGFLRGQVEKANVRTETAIDGVVAGEEAAAGQADVQAATGRVHITINDAREATHAFEIETRTAPDGQAPLAVDRADRLRAHDGVLCGLRSGLCADRSDGVAAPPDPAA
jgi:hypothetical protein